MFSSLDSLTCHIRGVKKADSSCAHWWTGRHSNTYIHVHVDKSGWRIHYYNHCVGKLLENSTKAELKWATHLDMHMTNNEHNNNSIQNERNNNVSLLPAYQYKNYISIITILPISYTCRCNFSKCIHIYKNCTNNVKCKRRDCMCAIVGFFS